MNPASVKRARRRAEQLMIDTCRVTRIRRDVNGDPVTTTVAGVVTVQREQVYPDSTLPGGHPLRSGRAKRQTFEGYEQSPSVAGQSFTIQRYAAHFPVGAFKPQVGDDIEWITCPLDADRVGTHDRITALFNKTAATAMRVFVDEEV